MATSPTQTKAENLATVTDRANPNQIADALARIKLGRMLDPVKITLAAITAAAAVDITSFLKGVSTLTINQGLRNLDAGQALPPILDVTTLRVTTVGTAAAGARLVTDAGGTPSATVATISDDGKTLTFEGTVTGLVLEYTPRADVDFSEKFAPVPS